MGRLREMRWIWIRCGYLCDPDLPWHWAIFVEDVGCMAFGLQKALVGQLAAFKRISIR